METGILYLVATPIGNLGDISQRAVEILNSVSLVAAEDTRISGSLLKKLDIKKPLISYYEHNAVMREEKLINTLLSGESIALITDAGTPGISDPGELIVKKCIENNIDVIPVPGACAFVSALIVSGFSTERFIFIGFLSAKTTEREKTLENYKFSHETLIFYEAPHRLIKTLESMKDIFGVERKVCISREITKKFEEHKRFTLKDALNYYSENTIKGEFVIIVEGCIDIPLSPLCEQSLEEHLQYYLDMGKSKNDSIKAVAKDRNMPKRSVYDYFAKK